MNLPFSLSFTSFGYLACLSVLILLCRLFPGKWRPLLLLLASVCYYGALMPSALPILAVAAAGIYLIGLWFGRLSAKEPPPKKLSALLPFGACLLLLLLFLLKYLPPMVEALGGREFSLLAPLGISYFTFSGIAYLLDVSKGRIPVQKSFLSLSLYLLFFPRITSGPIQRPAEFFFRLDGFYASSQRLMADPTEDREGLLLLLSGFLKKLALSDLLAPGIAAVYGNPVGQSGFAVLFATFLYAWQLYGDFSGYTDLARGSGLLLGIRMPENFDHPYRACSIREFWRRWHISLSGFLRDYVYIPLGGSRKGRGKKLRNLFITFLVSGVWHGASLTYVLWGAWHGLLQMLEDLTDPLRKKLLAALPRGEKSLRYRIPAVLLTFTGVLFGWMLFRAEHLTDLPILLSSFTAMGSILEALTLLFDSVWLPLNALLSLLLAHQIHKKAVSGETVSLGELLPALLAAALLLITAMSGNTGGGAFIYIGF